MEIIHNQKINGRICLLKFMHSPGTSFIIGNAEESGRMFRGNIDDVRFYSRALTEEEINLLYSEGGWSNYICA